MLSMSPTSPRMSYQFPSTSPSGSVSNRSSLTAAMASSAAAILPPPPPPESIKLQRVPTAVRIAQTLHALPTMTSTLSSSQSSTGAGMLAAPTMSASTSSSSADPPVFAVTATPFATQHPSPADTDSSTPSSSRRYATAGPSRSSSRSGRHVPAPIVAPAPSPPTSGHERSQSAFSPLFAIPPTTSGRRERSRTIVNPDVFSLPPVQPVVESPPDLHYGASPLSRGLSPLALAGMPTRAFSAHVPAALPLHARISAPKADRGHQSDEYAQIIMQSRTAKMKKWKGSELQLSPGRRRARLPSFDEADITDSLGLLPGAGSTNKEIEWVDWLEDYRKMKEAKLAAEQAGELAGFGHQLLTRLRQWHQRLKRLWLVRSWVRAKPRPVLSSACGLTILAFNSYSNRKHYNQSIR